MTAALPRPEPPQPADRCDLCNGPAVVYRPNAALPLLPLVKHCPRCDRPPASPLDPPTGGQP